MGAVAVTGMIERIARVIAHGQGARGVGKADAQWFEDKYWRDSIADARAVLAEILEPTQEMVNAAWIDDEDSPTGVLVLESSTSHCSGENLPYDTAYEVWQAMIGAALKEETT